MDETATTLPARAPGLPRFRAATGELDRRLFVGGVSAITLAVAVFLFVQLDKWPPHEDETLPLFVGRHSLTDAFDIVLAKRGGAPLHFLLAWIVAHTGGGLHEMRMLSALFAIASVPAIAVLGNRLAGRAPALAAAALAAASWVLLFHGIYARMYSLFLLLSTLSYLALLRALKRGGWGAWALWSLAMLLTIAAHQYGALVLASQGLLRPCHPGALAPGDPRLRGRRRPRDPALAREPRARRSLRHRRHGEQRRPLHAAPGLRVSLARRRRLVSRIHRRARRLPPARPRRPRIPRPRPTPRRAPRRLRRPDADALLPASASSAAARRRSLAT